jgi:peptide/nickel transport system permease protein
MIKGLANSLLKRCAEGIIFLWLISLVSFLLMKMAPGDVTLSLLRVDDMVVTQEQIALAREELGLNAPWLMQYARYMAQLMGGDLGQSVMTGRPVLNEIMTAFPATLALAGYSLLIMLVFIGVLGSLSARYPRRMIDRLTASFCLLGASVPSFWLGLLLISLFSVQLKWLPTGGLVDWRGLILPSVTLAIAMCPPYIKLFKESLLETERQDYIRAARARGLSEKVIFIRHILQGSLIPVITVLGVSLSSLLGGTVIIEVIFGLPGLGKMAVEAVFRRDYVVMQGFIIFMGILTFAINLLVDISYRFLDPAIGLKEFERR